MTARDLSPEQIKAVDAYIAGKPHGNKKLARSRQIVTVARILVAADQMITEAAEARISAPGLLEIRDWCDYTLTEIAIQDAPRLYIEPDAVKDAVAGSVLAARSGDPKKYAEARALEADARKGAV
ncbi:MAG: hypothetical protein NTV11_05435 [Rhodocyclales bacterium]|nr:hypothetical protein [Rhodocyclales bacterium]